MPSSDSSRPFLPLCVDGKFFSAGGRRVFLKAVSYGPFPDPEPDPVAELERVAGAGFNAIRVYGEPRKELLDAAQMAGLWVIVGLSWEWGRDFMSRRGLFAAARVDLVRGLKLWGHHPAVAMVMVANEIPADMVRWMGVVKVRRALETLIECGRSVVPGLLFAYSNFPTTEFLEPDNADLTAMNVYLETRSDFEKYVLRLHHVAGDRPVLISEFGMDALGESELNQRDVLEWQLEVCLQAGMAGTTVFSWSDRWLNGGRVMDGWAFGLTDLQGRGKPALARLAGKLPWIETPEDGLELERWPRFSVVVCSYNGAGRLRECLRALQELDYPDYEILLVDDGSTDETASVVRSFTGVRLITLDHVGLSAARNRGAEEARGEIVAYTDDDCEPDAAWLRWLAWSFERYGWDACGGPNLPPVPEDRLWWEHVDEAVVASAPGAPTHVMLNDSEAEHLPGCNLVVKKRVLEALGGFSVAYRVAGDDVDLCWRLRAAGYRMGFCGAAFVWHRRRTTLWRYFKQQHGYGKAEALLMRDHPDKFHRGGGAHWDGHVYGGGAMCAVGGSVIYHGVRGLAPYQQLMPMMQPQRPLARGFQGGAAGLKLFLAQNMQPWIRAISRGWHGWRWRKQVAKAPKVTNLSGDRDFSAEDNGEWLDARWWGESGSRREDVLEALVLAGWRDWNPEGAELVDESWDLIRAGVRLLIACEQGVEGCHVLTRMSGRGVDGVPADFQRVMEGMGLTRM